MSSVVEEFLYSAMEDYKIDLVIDKGPSARSVQIQISPFTLIGGDHPCRFIDQSIAGQVRGSTHTWNIII